MDKVDMSGFGIKWNPEILETSDPFAADFEKSESERRHLFGFVQIEATPAHFGRALAIKNYWTYLENGK